MEVYFKDLISKEASLEQIVDDVVNDADEFARVVGGNLSENSRDEMARCLRDLKKSYARLKRGAISGARATDRAVRANPYISLGVVFVAGLLVGSRFLRDK